MDKKPSIKAISATPKYQDAASQISKAYVFLFFIFCGIIGYIDQPVLGLYWILILIIGMFGASLLVAAPITYIKLLLGTKTNCPTIVIRQLDLVGYIILWFLTRYSINYFGG